MLKDNYWSIDKKVPVALMLAILLQTASAIWWAASVSSRIEYLEKIQSSSSTLVERVVRLEVMSEQNRTTLDRIDRKLDGALSKTVK